MKSKSEEELLWGNGEGLVYHMITHFQNIRCLSQKGSFTLSTNIFDDHDIYIGNILDLSLEKNKGLCTRIIIPKELKKDFLARLYLMGISSETLFPGVEGLCDSFNNLIDIRSGEELDLMNKGFFSIGGNTKNI